MVRPRNSAVLLVLVPTAEEGNEWRENGHGSHACLRLRGSNRDHAAGDVDIPHQQALRFRASHSCPSEERDDDLLGRSNRGLKEGCIFFRCEPVVSASYGARRDKKSSRIARDELVSVEKREKDPKSDDVVSEGSRAWPSTDALLHCVAPHAEPFDLEFSKAERTDVSWPDPL